MTASVDAPDWVDQCIRAIVFIGCRTSPAAIASVTGLPLPWLYRALYENSRNHDASFTYLIEGGFVCYDLNPKGQDRARQRGWRKKGLTDGETGSQTAADSASVE